MRWYVSEGEHVVADQPIVAVETDKAVVEIPAPAAGRVVRILAAAGEVVPIGEPLVEFDDEGRADQGTVVGTLAGDVESAATVRRPRPGRTSAAPPAARAMPAARALASRLRVDLSTLEGTGRDGTITRADVERAAAEAGVGALEPLRGVRRAMARNMSRAGAEVVLATVTDEADVDGWPPNTEPTVRLIEAVAGACATEPALNAWYVGASQSRRLHDKVDVGIAVDTDDGLFVPVLRDAGSRDAVWLAAEVTRLAAAVADRTITPEEMRDPTITLSNFGMIGGRHAALVVVPPQVAIVGAGSIAERVVARDGHPSVRRIVPLSISFDHRAVTGGEAARFLAAIVSHLEAGE